MAAFGQPQQSVLRVDIIGHGDMRVINAGVEQQHLLFVISIQQQAAAWTVYRRVGTFHTLAFHLLALIPGLPPCPNTELPAAASSAPPGFLGGAGSPGGGGVEQLRIDLRDWMRSLISVPAVPQTPVMRNFLCAEANLPPPGLDITWCRSSTGGGEAPFDDEMDMDEMFDRHLDDREGADSAHGMAGDRDSLGAGFIRNSSSGRGGNGGGGGGGAGGGLAMMTQSVGSFPTTSLGGTWQPVEPGVAHSFNQRQSGSLGFSLGDGAAFGDGDDDDSDFEHDALEVEPLANDPFMPQAQTEASAQSSSSVFALPTNDQQQAQPPSLAPLALPSSDANTAGAASASSSQSSATASSSNTETGTNKASLALDNFLRIKVIGKGSFGKVFLVREKSTGTIYAMKVLRKENIIKRNQIEHTRTERSVLGYVRHPFIVGLKQAFQTRDKLFFVLDYCAGGELFFHLGKLGTFPEVRARFYAAEITLALGYVHGLNIVYRDLKPENVLLDERGHVRLTDFGLSKEAITDNASGANSFCGTPEYLAPEILNRQGHGRAVDWWSLGALLYEMLTGLPPFYCRDREKLFEKIRSADLTYPKYLSRGSMEILRGLITRDPSVRLGSGPTDVEEVKGHYFFADHLDWTALAAGRLSPPWEPTVVGSLDTSQFDNEFTSMPLHSPSTGGGHLGGSHGDTDTTFAGFSYSEQPRFMGAGGLGGGGGGGVEGGGGI